MRWAANTGPTVIVVDESSVELDAAKDRLQSVGINAQIFRRGSSALVEVGRQNADAALISADVTDVSCIDWVRAAREASQIPILVGVHDGQLGHLNAVLMAVAAAILSYPFDEVEFADELQREWETPRARNVSRGHLCVGLLELDAPSFSVTFDGRRLRLSLGAFELLWCLMVRANRVVGADEISRALGRPESVLGSGAFVKAQVARLRTELGERNLIQTVRGQGYTLRHLLEQPHCHPR